MSLLEVITKASAVTDKLTLESGCLITLNPDPIFSNLKPRDQESNETSLVKSVGGWNFFEKDVEIIDLGQKFLKQLNRSIKNPKFSKDEFIGMLNSYLEKNGEKIGMATGGHPMDVDYTKGLIKSLGFVMGRQVLCLVLEACVGLELWDLVETLICQGFVEFSCSSNLVRKLIEKRRSDLVCLCVKHISDLQMSDILLVLKYFLSPPEDAFASMVTLRKEWESQALFAIQMATDETLNGKKASLAKDASILLMIAHDEFTVSELCLHYLLASPNLDEVLFSFCVSKLNGSEMMGFACYLEKWLRKYDEFPQACPCPEASSMLGLRACEWVPTLEEDVKCLGLVLDEHFSSLVRHPEFREKLKSMEPIVSSLASDARLCCSFTNLIGNLKAKLAG